MAEAERGRGASRDRDGERYAAWVPLLVVASILGACVSMIPAVGLKSDNNLPVYFLLVGLAGLAWPTIRNLRFGKDGLSLEKFEEMRGDVKTIEKSVDTLAAAVAHVTASAAELDAQAKKAAGVLEQLDKGNRELRVALDQAQVHLAERMGPKPTAVAADVVKPPALDRPSKHADDPQKGRWGGLPESKERGWRLTARVEASTLEDEWFVIRAEVSSTMANRPLRKPVSFFVHPTFPKSRYDIEPVAGTARLELRGWGAFTIGAWVQDDGTELELDLAELGDEAPKAFKAR